MSHLKTLLCVKVSALCDKYCCPSCGISSWASIVIMITRLLDGWSGFDSWQGQLISLFSKMSWLNLGSTQPLIWLEALLLSIKWTGWEKEHSNRVPWLWKSGGYLHSTSLPSMPSWHAQELSPELTCIILKGCNLLLHLVTYKVCTKFSHHCLITVSVKIRVLSRMYLLYFAVNSTRTGSNVAPTAPPAWKLAIQRTSLQNHAVTLWRMQISVIFVMPSPLKVITQKHLVATRWRNHRSVKSHECDICNREFSVSAALRIYSLSHLGVKTNVTYVWGNLLDMKSWKSIVLPTQVRSHISVMFVAKISQNANPQRQQSTLSGEKPYKCDFCWKAFSRIERLKSHLEIHVWLWVCIFCFGMPVGLCSLCFFP
jgi:hypothetical protein